MRFALICLTAFASVSLTLAASAAEHTKESLAEIKQRIESKQAALVDVRERNEWDKGHILGAIFLPLSAIRDGLSKDELKKLPKDKVLYFHCVVGQRALMAANAVEKHGFTSRAVKPGYKEMIAAGFPKGMEKDSRAD